LVELELRVVGSHRKVVVRGLIGEMMIAALGSRGTTGHVFPLVVLVLLPWDMGSLVAR
jgi:hypothetical protein